MSKDRARITLEIGSSWKKAGRVTQATGEVIDSTGKVTKTLVKSKQGTSHITPESRQFVAEGAIKRWQQGSDDTELLIVNKDHPAFTHNGQKTYVSGQGHRD